MKLAFVAALLLGACVADDPQTSARIEPTQVVGPFNVIDQAETAQITPDNIDLAIVVITGVEIPGLAPTKPHIDITNVAIADLDPAMRQLCADAGSLPVDDVCSSLCDSTGFIARLYDQGAAGECVQNECHLPDATVVTVETCLP